MFSPRSFVCRVAALILAWAGLSSVAFAQNLLTNGSFTADFSGATLHVWTDPQNPANYENYYYFADKPAAIAGWTYAPGIAGDVYIQMSAANATAMNSNLGIGWIPTFGGGSAAAGGSLAQTFTATAGQQYVASLDVAGIGYMQAGAQLTFGIYEAANDAAVATFTASVIGGQITSSWQTFTLDFTAPTSSLYFKVFDSTTGGADSTDVAFTAASVSAVPEPSAYAAFAGLGALGLVCWRRRAKRTV